MTTTRIFIPQLIPEDSLARLRELGSLDVFDGLDRRITRSEVLDRVSGADVLVALGQIEFDRDVIDAAEACKLIAAMHSTASFVDIGHATEKGIVVTGIPTTVSETTAEYTFALLMATAWRIPEADRFLRDGRWTQNQSVAFLGSRIAGKRIGIVGMGVVGQGVARRAGASGMEIVYHKRSRLPSAVESALGAGYRDLDSLFAECDFVVLTVALNDETRSLVDERRLMLMKQDAVLINTSRGEVVDEDALARALEEGRIRGAGLDVFRHEPPDSPAGPGDRLTSLPNVILTPHIGTAARETREEMASVLVDNIAAFLEGTPSPNVLNPDVYSSGGLRSARPRSPGSSFQPEREETSE